MAGLEAGPPERSNHVGLQAGAQEFFLSEGLARVRSVTRFGSTLLGLGTRICLGCKIGVWDQRQTT